MRAWCLTDGGAGNVAQARALAEALDAEVILHSIAVNRIWRLLPNRMFDFGLAKCFPVLSRSIQGEEPNIIISCGRKGALASAFLKTKAMRIHIHDPQMSRKHFDLVIAMAHDGILGANIIRTPYALHNITPEKLAAAQAHWEPKFAHLPRPWNAVLIGGSTNKYRFGKDAMQALIHRIDAMEGSLLITSSRRTGEENIALLASTFGGRNERVFLYTGELENPYMGMLACADRIYVTNDSVNMMSEAAASGKPYEILALAGHSGTKPARFAETVKSLKTTPQQMMGEVAASVREMLANRP